MRPLLASLNTGLILTSSNAGGFRFNEPKLDGEQKQFETFVHVKYVYLYNFGEPLR